MTEAVRLITKQELQQQYEAVERLASMVRNGGFYYQSLQNCRNNLEIHARRRQQDYDDLCTLSRQSHSFRGYHRYFDDKDDSARKYQRLMLKDWHDKNPEVQYHPAYQHVFTDCQKTFLEAIQQ